MRIRPAEIGDLDHLIDLDGTIESAHYLHVEPPAIAAAVEAVVGGSDPAAAAAAASPPPLVLGFGLEERPLREKLIDRNAVGDDARFVLKQLLTGAEDGIARAVEHDGQLTGLVAARHDPARQVLELIDLRIDYEYRRQGLGSALVFQVISHAREIGVRAVTAVTRTNNLPAARFMLKSGFDLCGLDTRLATNHDLVKEAVALFWYAALS
jgi:N-acetylglutamate synthase-like GNAT family acetyltransferase